MSKFKNPYYFDGILRRILDSFLFQVYPNDKEFDYVYDELVRLFKENVRPEYVRPYRSNLEDSISRPRKIIKKQELIVEKLKPLETYDEHPEQ